MGSDSPNTAKGYSWEEATEIVRRRFHFREGGRHEAHLLGVLHVVRQPAHWRRARTLTLRTPPEMPPWTQCAVWLHESAQKTSFRRRWRKLATRFAPMAEVVFVRVAEPGGVSPVPYVTWCWRDNPSAKRRMLNE